MAKRKSRRKSSRASSRSVMFLASSLWVAVILVVFVFRGGGAVPVDRPAAGPGVESWVALAAEAEGLMGRGEYEAAWRAYHRALEQAPEEVGLWYGLGVVLSHVGRPEEAERAFRYVVERGAAEGPEVEAARQWLVRAGVLAERPVVFRPSSAVAAETAERRGDRAAIRGRVSWGAAAGPGPLKAQLVLVGVSGGAEGQRHATRVPLGGEYRFERLAPGTYRLTGGAAGHRLWEVTLDVEDGKQLILDLTKDNSANPAVSLFL
jgi:tetratricopeptide (TPR) repeat protein